MAAICKRRRSYKHGNVGVALSLADFLNQNYKRRSKNWNEPLKLEMLMGDKGKSYTGRISLGKTCRSTRRRLKLGKPQQ